MQWKAHLTFDPAFFLLLLLLLLHLNVPMVCSWLSHGVCEVTTHTWRGKKKTIRYNASSCMGGRETCRCAAALLEKHRNCVCESMWLETQRTATTCKRNDERRPRRGQTFVTSFELLRPVGWGTRLIKRKHGPSHWPRRVKGRGLQTLQQPLNAERFWLSAKKPRPLKVSLFLATCSTPTEFPEQLLKRLFTRRKGESIHLQPWACVAETERGEGEGRGRLYNLNRVSLIN